MTSRAKSKVDIANLAASYLDAGAVDNIDTPKGKVAVSIAREYDTERLSALESANWVFARERKSLAALTADPLFGYKYQYKLPTDYVRLFSIPNQEPLYYDHSNKIEYSLEQGNILIGNTNYDVPETEGVPDALNIIYVKNEELVSKFSNLFVKYLAARIARKLAYAITQKPSVVQMMREEVRELEIEANSFNSQMNPMRRYQSSRLINAQKGVNSKNVGTNFVQFP